MLPQLQTHCQTAYRDITKWTFIYLTLRQRYVDEMKWRTGAELDGQHKVQLDREGTVERRHAKLGMDSLN